MLKKIDRVPCSHAYQSQAGSSVESMLADIIFYADDDLMGS